MLNSGQKEIDRLNREVKYFKNQVKYLMRELQEARQLQAAYKTIALLATKDADLCQCVACCEVRNK